MDKVCGSAGRLQLDTREYGKRAKHTADLLPCCAASIVVVVRVAMDITAHECASQLQRPVNVRL